MSSTGTELHPWGSNNFHYCPTGWCTTYVGGFEEYSRLIDFREALLSKVHKLAYYRDQICPLMTMTPAENQHHIIHGFWKASGNPNKDSFRYETNPSYTLIIQYHPNDQQIISIIHRTMDEFGLQNQLLGHTFTDCDTFSDKNSQGEHWKKT